jgi:hypothetical protein
MKVKVFDGTGRFLLGYGNYDVDVETYVVQMPDGSIRSCPNAEQAPEAVPEGAVLRKISKNPKIIMDDGSIRYGCQVWWEPVKGDDVASAVGMVEVGEESVEDPWNLN